jgi:hypothetical protein
MTRCIIILEEDIIVPAHPNMDGQMS